MNALNQKQHSDPSLPTPAEAKLAVVPTIKTSANLADEPLQVLLQELRVHQVELEVQNEALRQMQSALEESRDRYVDLYEFAPVGYFTLTSDCLISKINLTGAARLGRDRKSLLQKSFTSFVCHEDRDRWVRHFLRVKNHDGQGSTELTLQRGDGTIIYAQLDCVRQKIDVADRAKCPGADSLQLLVALTDISERKLAEELRIVAIAFASQSGMLITDPRGVILRVNPAFTRITGYSAEDVIGQTPALLKSGRHDSLFYRRMWDSLNEKGYWQGEIWNKHKNGQVYSELLAITAITSPERGVTHYVGSFYDITESKAAEAEIHRMAYYDPLTRLPNRRLLEDRLGQAVASTARSGLYGAICFVDLDNFKTLNDTRGHDVGDLLLVEVAQRLRSVVRESDTVARQGGDEFVVLLEHLGTEASEAAVLAKQLGEKLREAIDSPFKLKGHEYHCKISVGIGLFHGHDTVEDLLKHADLALYQAKSAGCNRLRLFDPGMQEELDRRCTLEAELGQALEHKQLQLYYQPQVDVTRRVIGVEAMLRWQHPQRGLLSPNDFIRLAEETGLILPIGLWGLETVCALLNTWANDVCTGKLQVAINVSARQFRQSDFVDQVRMILETSGANPACLKLELTESLVLEDVEDTIEKMEAIKHLGVHFSLDNFGTGYSSLYYLAQLPIDELKIDRSFVRNLPEKKSDETIIRTIITMGRGLAMNVMAEGVDTEAQREYLEMHGCYAYQGSLFSRPLPLEKLEEFLKRG